MTLHKPDDLPEICIKQDVPNGPLTLWIDGQKNPFAIADEPVRMDVSRQGLPIVRVGILCSSLTVSATWEGKDV